MTLEEYNRWLAVAVKHSRRDDEAEDLLQDGLLIAAREGRLDFDSEENRRWFSGVLRNRGAMTGRSEFRRRRREESLPPREEESHPTGIPGRSDLLSRLPPAARQLAALILHGMTRREIEYALRLTPTAFRQRMTTIRKVVSDLAPDDLAESMAFAYSRRNTDTSGLEYGLIRRALLGCLRSESEIGTHDPDGHLIVLNVRPR